VIAHFFYPGTRILDTPACPVRVIVDAGANIGMETVRMRHFFPQARILAIEASAENYRVLATNAAKDKGFVETLNNGVWSNETALRLQPAPPTKILGAPC
jgi:FkbM family methyltransferase